ncbi:MAG: methionyl-tRNA formyltransferase [Deltaproteobacteria bacterium]|nr:methionyl-tRNA formyltransferase [Deltaproteobacteria bacterium]
MAERLRAVFMGSPEFAVTSLRALATKHDILGVVCQPDKPAGRGKHLSPPAIKVAATLLNLPVWQPTTLKGEEGSQFVESMRALRPDVLIVVAYGKILPQSLLDVPRLGPLNVHASLLPRYRGAAPIQWSILNRDLETGVCIMRMEAGLDSGPVLACKRTTIGSEETSGDLFARLAVVGSELLLEILPQLAEGTVCETPQNGALATLAPLLRKEDGRLDFSQAAESVGARARGVDPWPGAFARLNGEPVKLWRPSIRGSSTTAAEPGTIVAAGSAGLEIACGTGAVVFAEMQLAGRKRLPVSAVLSGHAIALGTRLD